MLQTKPKVRGRPRLPLELERRRSTFLSLVLLPHQPRILESAPRLVGPSRPFPLGQLAVMLHWSFGAPWQRVRAPFFFLGGGLAPLTLLPSFDRDDHLLHVACRALRVVGWWRQQGLSCSVRPHHDVIGAPLLRAQSPAACLSHTPSAARRRAGDPCVPRFWASCVDEISKDR